jgi:hypothetical protein
MRVDPDFADAVRDAELLLRYASAAGIVLPDGTIEAIAHARACLDAETITEDVVVKFFAAFTVLAAKAAPVTTETLRVSHDRTRRSLRWNGVSAIILALVVVIFSGISFVTVSLSHDIGTDIEHANELAVTLHHQVGPPSPGKTDETQCGPAEASPSPPIPSSTDEVVLISNLQDFASTLRTLLRTASKLDFFVLDWETSPLSEWKTDANDRLQLQPGLVNMRKETFCKIAAYEDVRDFGQNVRTDTLVIYGAISAYLLPVLYALLGAFAFNLRDFSERVRLRTYHPSSYASMARTIAAMTVGAIISLFNVFGHDTALQPLAIAFLAGYGVEVFFAFLDALLTTFGLRRGPAGQVLGASDQSQLGQK